MDNDAGLNSYEVIHKFTALMMMAGKFNFKLLKIIIVIRHWG